MLITSNQCYAERFFTLLWGLHIVLHDHITLTHEHIHEYTWFDIDLIELIYYFHLVYLSLLIVIVCLFVCLFLVLFLVWAALNFNKSNIDDLF